MVVGRVRVVVGLAFGARQAGRALSAFNLAIFVGIFVVQWAIGLLSDAARALGAREADALRWAFGAWLVPAALAHVHFLRTRAPSGAGAAPVRATGRAAPAR